MSYLKNPIGNINKGFFTYDKFFVLLNLYIKFVVLLWKFNQFVLLFDYLTDGIKLFFQTYPVRINVDMFFKIW